MAKAARLALIGAAVAVAVAVTPVFAQRSEIIPVTQHNNWVRQWSAVARRDAGHCWERAVDRGPVPPGRLTVALTVEPTGSVRSARIGQDSIRDGWLRHCVLKAVLDATAGVRFPRPASGGTVAVSIPFLFRYNPTALTELGTTQE